MTIRTRIEQATGMSWLVSLAGAVILALVALFLVDRVFWAPGRARTEVAQAKGGAVVAAGQLDAARDSIRITERTHDKTTRIETIRDAGIASVLAAPDDRAAGDAARHAACLLHYDNSEPACVGLLDPGAAKPAG